MKHIAIALVSLAMTGPVLANKLHQQSPSASEVKAWKAEQQQHKADQKHSNKHKTASAPAGKVKTTIGGHEHNK